MLPGMRGFKCVSCLWATELTQCTGGDHFGCMQLTCNRRRVGRFESGREQNEDGMGSANQGLPVFCEIWSQSMLFRWLLSFQSLKWDRKGALKEVSFAQPWSVFQGPYLCHCFAALSGSGPQVQMKGRLGQLEPSPSSDSSCFCLLKCGQKSACPGASSANFLCICFCK